MEVYILYAFGSGMLQLKGVVTELRVAQKWSAYSASNTWKRVTVDDAEIYQELNLRKPRARKGK